jgi:predicted transcriptional regulator
MPKDKQAYELTLEVDQMNFLRSSAEKYGIVDEDKAARVVMDYVMSNRDIQDSIFNETRCLRCG